MGFSHVQVFTPDYEYKLCGTFPEDVEESKAYTFECKDDTADKDRRDAT